VSFTAHFEPSAHFQYNRRVRNRFDELGIEIPFPHQTIYFGEGKQGAAPPATVRVMERDDVEAGRRQPEIVRPEEIDSDGDGLTDVYEKKVGLNPFDASDAFADPDCDGFSNIEEFQADTDPFDSKDFPNPVVKLRVVRVVNRPFRMRFQGVQTLANGEIRFLLNLRTLERSYFVKIGDVIDGYKVVGYEPKIRKTPAGKVDESVLTLRKGDRLIPLVKNLALTRYERVAYLALLTDASRFVVHVGDTITVRDRIYKIIDILGDGVLLRDVQSDAEVLVSRIAESELQELRDKLRGGGRSTQEEARSAAFSRRGRQR